MGSKDGHASDRTVFLCLCPEAAPMSIKSLSISSLPILELLLPIVPAVPLAKTTFAPKSILGSWPPTGQNGEKPWSSIWVTRRAISSIWAARASVFRPRLGGDQIAQGIGLSCRSYPGQSPLISWETDLFFPSRRSEGLAYPRQDIFHFSQSSFQALLLKSRGLEQAGAGSRSGL